MNEVPQPLTGVRVLDLTQVWAGPLATRFLADLGAEVVKIESVQRPDNVRFQRYMDNDSSGAAWEKGWWFGLNRRKRDLTLDLGTEVGRAIFRRLVPLSDVVIENFSPRVMRNWGLNYEALRALRADIVMCSLSGFGQTGPARDYIAYGVSLEPSGGFSGLTGHPDGPPVVTGSSVSDPISGMMGAAAVLAGLRRRALTGQGAYIDLAEREVVMGLIGDHLVHYTLHRCNPVRWGNRHAAYAPQGCYPARGEDRWIVISVMTDEQWKRLCQVMGRHDLEHDPRLIHARGRHEHHDAIDDAIASWTRERDARETMLALQAMGVPAAAVSDTRDLALNPQLWARGFFQKVAHPLGGLRIVLTAPFQLNGHAPPVGPAPLLGQHNRRILEDLLGLMPDEMASLEAAEVIGTQPKPGVPPVPPLQHWLDVGAAHLIDPEFKVRLGLDQPRQPQAPQKEQKE